MGGDGAGTACLVYDERPQIRRRLELLLRSADAGDEVVGAEDVADLLARVADVVRWAAPVVVVGVAPRSPGGPDAVRRVLDAWPGIPVLVAGPGGGSVDEALADGATGFLQWDAPRAVARAVTRAARDGAAGAPLRPGGETLVDPRVQEDLDLSVREVQVLLGVSRGLPSAEIGRRLYLSEHTVKSHVARLLRKLDAADRAAAVAQAFRSGLFVLPARRVSAP